MKCNKCGKKMQYSAELTFNECKIAGWKCICGETYYDPAQAQKILLLNKLKKEAIKTKLGQIRSNLILRLPKGVEDALGLQKGKSVLIQVEDSGFRVVPV
jgi:hypothetical protein